MYRHDEAQHRASLAAVPKRAFLILLSLAIGVGVSLLTKNAFAGAAIPFVVAAWRSFRSGVFIFQNDTDADRGRVCFVFQLAAGFWFGAASAFLTVVMFLVVYQWTGQNPDMSHFAAVMWTFVFGIAANATLASFAIGDAVQHRVKVWVQPDLCGLFDESFRLKSPTDPVPGFNYAIFVIATTAFIPAGVAIFVAGAFGAKPPFDLFDNLVLPVFILVVVPMLVLVGYGFLSQRIVAVSPVECWPERPESCSEFRRPANRR